MIESRKLHPSHLRKVVRARSRWARRTLEDQVGLFVRRWPLHGSAPSELGNLLHSLDVDCVIDVGAHHGGFGRICRRLGFEGDIVSFEPSSEASARLQRTIAKTHDDRWVAHQLALGSEPGMMQLGVFEQTQLNSLRSPSEGKDLINDRPLATEAVRVARLDDVWDELVPSTSKRPMIKIDAQGFDIEVLRGAEESLSRSVAVQVEVSGSSLYDDVPPVHEVMQYLFERSYRITGLFPIVREPADRVQVVDFDATFVRIPVTLPAM